MGNSPLGLKKGTVKLVAHNKQWTDLFEKEKKMLLARFPDVILELSHGGSTAIPNIPAKPIIDMFAVILSLKLAGTIKSELESLGYEYRGEAGVPERVLFVKGPEELRTHHLQFVEQGSTEWKNHLIIKHYYLKHPEVAEEYARLKKLLAEKYPNDRVAYGKGKHDFIQSVIGRARQDA